jgi:hypothetical protein
MPQRLATVLIRQQCVSKQCRRGRTGLQWSPSDRALYLSVYKDGKRLPTMLDCVPHSAVGPRYDSKDRWR